MLVKDIMTTAVKTAHPDSLIREVAMVMCFNKISGMPVVDDDGRIVGMISEKDILWGMFPDLQDFMGNPEVADFEAFERDYKDVVNLKVQNLMTTRVYAVEPTMPVLKAASMMFRHRLRRLPVADNGKLVGIVSVGDVHKAIFQHNITGRA
ncbi:signal transduction protein [Sulfurifustis variabilis]|uniref:Signal transduction protein n=2 Tax=Sulfurifustis variabilis TaxID=1675686 RepID=A0A1B4VC32_9GAMM|nr:signal transduction protein [Sulfurifustis variabilis]